MKLIRHYLNRTTQSYSPQARLPFSLSPGPKNVSSTAKQICTLVLPTHQDEVLHHRGRHGELPSSNPSNSRGRAGLSNHPPNQKVSPSKLSSHRHPLGRRHLRTLGPHHSRCFLRHDCSSNRRGTNILGNTKRPRAGTSNKDGTAAQISAARHVWEEDVQTYRTYTSVQQALKKQIISVFEPM
jgi:hypothetical protein